MIPFAVLLRASSPCPLPLPVIGLLVACPHLGGAINEIPVQDPYDDDVVNEAKMPGNPLGYQVDRAQRIDNDNDVDQVFHG